MSHVAFLLKTYPKSSETFISNQITALRDRGHTVDVYARQRPPESETAPQADPSDVVYLGPLELSDFASSILRTQIPALVSHPAYPLLVMRHGTNAVTQRDLWLRRARPLRDRLDDYDAIHAHYGPVGNGVRALASKTDAPFVTSFYGYDASELLEKNPWRNESLFQAVDTVASLSSEMDDRLVDHGCPRERVVRVPLPVDTSSFRYSPTVADEVETVELLSACRLVEKKGLRYVLDALDELRTEFPIRYRIAGDGPLRDDLERQVSNLGLEDIVSFEGWMCSEEVAGLMAASHVFVQPSVTSAEGDREGTPTVLIEAQARGMPVVSTYHAGIPEIVADGESGLLVPERDSEALASALRELLADPPAWETYGQRGRALIEDRHSLSAVGERLEAVYWRTDTR
jgi:colanic acid/amylovoran biosynthesis glycosyltransferase